MGSAKRLVLAVLVMLLASLRAFGGSAHRGADLKAADVGPPSRGDSATQVNAAFVRALTARVMCPDALRVAWQYGAELARIGNANPTYLLVADRALLEFARIGVDTIPLLPTTHAHEVGILSESFSRTFRRNFHLRDPDLARDAALAMSRDDDETLRKIFGTSSFDRLESKIRAFKQNVENQVARAKRLATKNFKGRTYDCGDGYLVKGHASNWDKALASADLMKGPLNRIVRGRSEAPRRATAARDRRMPAGVGGAARYVGAPTAQLPAKPVGQLSSPPSAMEAPQPSPGDADNYIAPTLSGMKSPQTPKSDAQLAGAEKDKPSDKKVFADLLNEKSDHALRHRTPGACAPAAVGPLVDPGEVGRVILACTANSRRSARTLLEQSLIFTKSAILVRRVETQICSRAAYPVELVRNGEVLPAQTLARVTKFLADPDTPQVKKQIEMLNDHGSIDMCIRIDFCREGKLRPDRVTEEQFRNLVVIERMLSCQDQALAARSGLVGYSACMESTCLVSNERSTLARELNELFGSSPAAALVRNKTACRLTLAGLVDNQLEAIGKILRGQKEVFPKNCAPYFPAELEQLRIVQEALLTRPRKYTSIEKVLGDPRYRSEELRDRVRTRYGRLALGRDPVIRVGGTSVPWEPSVMGETDASKTETLERWSRNSKVMKDPNHGEKSDAAVAKAKVDWARVAAVDYILLRLSWNPSGMVAVEGRENILDGARKLASEPPRDPSVVKADTVSEFFVFEVQARDPAIPEASLVRFLRTRKPKWPEEMARKCVQQLRGGADPFTF